MGRVPASSPKGASRLLWEVFSIPPCARTAAAAQAAVTGVLEA